MKFNPRHFLSRLQEYKDHYSAERLMQKIKRFGRKAGLKTVNAALLLYYASLDKSLPVKDRLRILAALGYFIIPADLVPDMLPLGFADDLAALTFVLKTVWGNLTPAVHDKARAKIEEWFGSVSDSDLSLPGFPSPGHQK